MENKKTRAKSYSQANKELQKRSREYYRTLFDVEKTKKEIMLILKTKICQTQMEKEKRKKRIYEKLLL